MAVSAVKSYILQVNYVRTANLTIAGKHFLAPNLQVFIGGKLSEIVVEVLFSLALNNNSRR